MRAALLGVTIPGHLPSEFGQRISPMTVELPNTRRVIPVLHGDRDQILGRVSGAAWTTDGGLALDITMTSTATARTFYAEQLADPRWPMYAHPLTAASPAGSYRRLSQLVAVKLWPVESWPSATVRVIRPPEFPIVIDRRGRIDSSRR